MKNLPRIAQIQFPAAGPAAHAAESAAYEAFNRRVTARVLDGVALEAPDEIERRLLVSFAEKAAARRRKGVASKRSIVARWSQATYIATSLAIIDKGIGRSPFSCPELTALYNDQRKLLGVH
ncbi:MAG: hypothetical protein JWR07_5100 [Nevskia sp.]|nr:hypothetical protein [Nevskia sp.]